VPYDESDGTVRTILLPETYAYPEDAKNEAEELGCDDVLVATVNVGVRPDGNVGVYFHV
jgi:hypothetical protein